MSQQLIQIAMEQKQTYEFDRYKALALKLESEFSTSVSLVA